MQVIFNSDYVKNILWTILILFLATMLVTMTFFHCQWHWKKRHSIDQFEWRLAGEKVGETAAKIFPSFFSQIVFQKLEKNSMRDEDFSAIWIFKF